MCTVMYISYKFPHQKMYFLRRVPTLQMMDLTADFLAAQALNVQVPIFTGSLPTPGRVSLNPQTPLLASNQ